MVRAKREELGLTMDELGQQVGAGRSTIHRIESAGETMARPDKLARVLIALGLSVEGVADSLPDDTWGRSVLEWMQRFGTIAEKGAARVAGDGYDLIGVSVTGGVVLLRITGDVDVDRVAQALQRAGLTVTRPI